MGWFSQKCAHQWRNYNFVPMFLCASKGIVKLSVSYELLAKSFIWIYEAFAAARKVLNYGEFAIRKSHAPLWTTRWRRAVSFHAVTHDHHLSCLSSIAQEECLRNEQSVIMTDEPLHAYTFCWPINAISTNTAEAAYLQDNMIDWWPQKFSPVCQVIH